MHPLVAAGGGVGGVVGAGSRMRAKEALEDGAVFQWGSFTSKMSNYSLRFSADEAEAEFRQQHFADYQDLNRYALLVLGVFVILLGFFDLGAFQSQNDALLRAWIMRLVMVLLISAAYLVNLSPRCTPLSMQVVTTGALAIVGVLLVQISLLFGREDDVYGIAVLMSVTSSSAIAFGLHFPFVCVVQAALLVAYVASNAIYERGFPLVTLFVITSSLLYAQSAYTTEYSNRTAFSQLVAREEEERRTTNLLNSMLPTEVLEELLSGGSTAIAHTFANASVLFADVVSFTAMAARMRPEDLVVFLNVLFSNFDRLSTTHNVYKVETIGDAYLACSGVVDAAPGHTRNLVEFGLDILDVSRRLETPDGDPVFLRVGIHTGAVVAGMVGFKMPRYHLFGDTYSIAESLESQGVKDSMVVSLATLQQLADEYESKEIEPIVCGGVPVRRFVLYGRRDA
jgi:class 3 adenylate cyclase